jgi:hypothetical protein
MIGEPYQYRHTFFREGRTVTTVQELLPAEEIGGFGQRWHVCEMVLFGSILRDAFRRDSDLNILITPAPRPSGFTRLCPHGSGAGGYSGPRRRSADPAPADAWHGQGHLSISTGRRCSTLLKRRNGSCRSKRVLPRPSSQGRGDLTNT